MSKRIVLCCAVSACFAVLLPAYAQRATELYTPIGQSPGVSGEFTVIGTIESVDEAGSSFRITGPTEPASAIVTERTRIYLDKSNRRETNRYGHLGDLKEGRRVEILYEDREAIGHGPAEWIKIEVAEPED